MQQYTIIFITEHPLSREKQRALMAWGIDFDTVFTTVHSMLPCFECRYTALQDAMGKIDFAVMGTDTLFKDCPMNFKIPVLAFENLLAVPGTQIRDFISTVITGWQKSMQ